VTLGQLVAGAGLGSALIARPEAPTKRELRALSGLQLAITSAIVLVAGGVMIAIGGDALVTAVMLLALPLTAFRGPAMLLFQRQLDFLTPIKVEIGETLVYLVVAVTLASLGFGPWSLGLGMVARALAGSAVAAYLSPLGFLVPSIELAHVRPLLDFGWRFQASGAVQVVTETLTTAAIAGVAGIGALGLWSMMSRILAVPGLLFNSMWKVGFPAFARLMQSGEETNVDRVLERTVGAFAVGTTAVLTPLVASSAALIPILFGDKWVDASLILPGAALGLAISGPMGLVGSSYFYARGDANTGLVASSASGAVRLLVAVPLLAPLGVAAVGIGCAAGAIVAMLYTVSRARRTTSARLMMRILGPALSGVAGAAVGWLVAAELGVNVVSIAGASLASWAVWLAVMAVLARSTLLDGIRLGRSVFGSAFTSARSSLRRVPVAAPSSS
jgi:O-antigen/teichoic acid export membrane protein